MTELELTPTDDTSVQEKEGKGININNILYKGKELSGLNQTLLEDQRLSWSAKGLLSYLLTRLADWEYNKSEIVRENSEEDIVKLALLDLALKGYLKLENDTLREGKSGSWYKRFYWRNHKITNYKEDAYLL